MWKSGEDFTRCLFDGYHRRRAGSGTFRIWESITTRCSYWIKDVKRESWWSVDVIVANRECDNWHATELSLVFSDSEASLKVQEKFAPGITFQLYEGPTLVAVGKFLASEPRRMEYVK